MNKTITLGAKKIALVSAMTATIVAGKFVLSSIPNVEVVTLLCASYGYVFGAMGLLAVSLFVLVESFIYGINSWILTYVIYWNLVCLIFWILAKSKVKNTPIIVLIAVVSTTFFGVLSSLVDVGLFGGIGNDFWNRFAIYYVRGTVFYIIQIVCNVILFAFAFKPFINLLNKLKDRYFSREKNKT